MSYRRLVKIAFEIKKLAPLLIAPFSISVLLALLLLPLKISYINKCLPTFDDEFNGQALDLSKWSTEYPAGNGGERQYYAPDAFSMKDGILNIYAEEKASHGYPYTSGIITTQQIFAQQYGYFVIRTKLPAGKGFWPAFWLLPVSKNYPVEIDVLELLGHDPHTIHLANHWRGQDDSHQVSKLAFTSEKDFSTGFHTFAVEWNPTEIKWYIDGELQFKVDKAIPSEPLFMLINLAVGGHWPGNPDASTQFPGVMQVDYVRVYGPSCIPSDAPNENR